MSKTRWLIIILVISWTLNVAFFVTVYFRACAAPRFPVPCPVIPSPLKDDRFRFPDNFRDNMREEAEPMHRELSRLIGQISLEFSADTLDTVRVYALSDSLNSIRSDLQRTLIANLCRNHGNIPPEVRQRLSKRLYGMMENHLQRMPCDRDSRRHYSKHFKPNKQEKQNF
ncbi:hypothetical protein K9N50_03905 [bacterium]|nr:hypothetical protein [bacterium]